jgi:hypothetical protein
VALPNCDWAAIISTEGAYGPSLTPSCLAGEASCTDLELLRPVLLGLEMSDIAAHYRSAHVMKQRLSFLFALFLLPAAAVPEAAASGSAALLIGLMV